MPSSFAVQSPADVVNLSLAKIGYKLRVGSLYDGSSAAKKALDIYAQTRDMVLRDGDWPFADRNVAGTLQKQSPVAGYIPPATWDPTMNPALPWRYQYAWGADFLKVLSIKSTPPFVPNFAPQPNIFKIANDNAFNPAQRVILCNVGPAAIIAYRGQVTDPSTWPNDFTEALADSLGEALTPLFANPEMLKLIAAERQGEMAAAMAEQG